MGDHPPFYGGWVITAQFLLVKTVKPCPIGFSVILIWRAI